MMKTNNANKQLLLVLAASVVIVTAFLIVMLGVNKISVEKVIGNECVRAGCSRQLCVNKGQQAEVTTCEWKEVYACYNLAKCELQDNGKCGYTPNLEFDNCVSKNTLPSVLMKKGK